MPSEVNNQPPSNKPISAPDIMLSGPIVEKICAYLTNPTILAKAQDGNMHPFIDPNPILAIFQEAINEALRSKGIPQSSSAEIVRPN